MSDLREALGDNFPNRLDWGYRWPGCRWRWGWLWAAWRWPGRPRGRCACPAAAAGSAGRGRPGGPGWPHLTLGCWSRGRRSGDIGFLHQHADEVTINNEWFILSNNQNPGYWAQNLLKIVLILTYRCPNTIKWNILEKFQCFLTIQLPYKNVLGW